MFIGVEENDYAKISDEERLRISRKITEKFATSRGAASNAPLKVVRPLEDVCRECTQRAPLGRSKYCAECIRRLARLERERSGRFWDLRRNRNFPGALYVLATGAIIFLIYLALSGWMTPPPKSVFQRTEKQATRPAGR